MNHQRVLFLAEGNHSIPSTMHRCIMIAGELNRKGIVSKVMTGWTIGLGKNGLTMPSPIGMARAATSVRAFDVLVINRAASTPILALVNYWKKAGRTVIYDCDDAVYLIRNPFFSRFDDVAKKASLVFAGSHELHKRFSSITKTVHLVPTPVDTHLFNQEWRAASNDESSEDTVTIGWMGTASLAIEELRTMIPVLRELGKSRNGERIRFSLFSALESQTVRTMFAHIPGIEFDPGPRVWTKFEDVPRQISKFDISIMPLRDTMWNRSKCATKLLESMAMGIPVVASDVGENKHVVYHGRNGFLASSSKDWIESLEVLVEDELLRKSMGASARDYVVNNYDVSHIAEMYASAFKNEAAEAAQETV